MILTRRAGFGIERVKAFLAEKNPRAANRAGSSILKALAMLRTAPEIGRPHAEFAELRELLIAYGDSGYVALYEYDRDESLVMVLAIRHQKEAGY